MGTNTERGSGRVVIALLMAAVAALCVVSWLLAKQNRALKRELAERAGASLPAVLAVGSTPPPLPLVDAVGVVHSMAPTAEHPALLLLIVSSDCPHCERTVPVYDEVITRAGNPKLRVLAIQTDAKGPGELKSLPITMTPVYAVDATNTWLHDLPMVPAALLLDRHGTITHQWMGEIGEPESMMFPLIGAGQS